MSSNEINGYGYANPHRQGELSFLVPISKIKNLFKKRYKKPEEFCYVCQECGKVHTKVEWISDELCGCGAFGKIIRIPK